MDRRSAVGAIGSIAGFGLFGAALAQQGSKTRRIGFLAVRSRPTSANPDIYYDGFVRAMKELGYVDGRNLIIEWRYADDRSDRLPSLAADLVKSNVEVLVTHGTPPTLALSRATSTIPIVAISITDPVGSGFAESLARPTGNVTGLTNIVGDTGPKLVELLKTLLPNLSKVAALVNPDNSTHPKLLQSLRTAASSLGMEVVAANARSPGEIEGALRTANKAKVRAVIVVPDSFIAGQSANIATLALKYRLPAISSFPEDATAGMLMSYGQSNLGRYRRAAAYVDKLLKGAKPSELPFEQTTLLELAVNARTAKQLGITVPPQILQRADRVVE